MRGEETDRAASVETEEPGGDVAAQPALPTDTTQPAIAAAAVPATTPLVEGRQPPAVAGGLPEPGATRIVGRSQTGPSSSEFTALNSDGRPPQLAAPHQGPTERPARSRPGQVQAETPQQRTEAGEERSGARLVGEPPPATSAVDTASIPTPLPAPQGAAAAGGDITQGYVPQVFGTGNAGSRVVLRALMDSWVQVTGAGDELLLTRILHAGDSYHLPNRRDLVLITGNAGALEILVDGAAVLPLGPIGAVRRDVSLDPDKLLGETDPGPLLGENSGQ